MNAKSIIKTLLCGLIAASSSQITAQTATPDTTGNIRLREVEVNARMQSISAQKTDYVPTRRQKQIATGGIDLLAQMAIPQISVNTETGMILTNTRKDVDIFINMQPATADELAAMRTADVRRIEYYDYPADARFQHKAHVINFVVHTPDYGGYAKAGVTGRIIATRASEFAYAKIARRRMTYDISVNDSYTHNRHIGENEQQTFRFPDSNDGIYDITRRTTPDNCLQESNRFAASFRARYATTSTMISNTVGLSTTNTPHSDIAGVISFIPKDFSGDIYRSQRHSRSMSPYWSGMYYLDCGHNTTLSIMPSLKYASNHTSGIYSSCASDPIINNADEKAWSESLNMQANRAISASHSIDLLAIITLDQNRVVYNGSSPSTERFSQGKAGALAGYSFSSDKFYARLSAGAVAEWNSISGTHSTDVIPAVDASVQYALSQRHSVEASMQYSANTNNASDKSPNVLRKNELLYITGNPLLKNPRVTSLSLSYTWLPSNQWSLTTDASYFHVGNRRVPQFTPDAPGGMMLRQPVNGGSYRNFDLGASLTSRLIGGRLTASVKPQLWFYHTTGLYDASLHHFYYELQATYRMGRFYISASYRSRDKMLVQLSSNSTSTIEKDTYQIYAGWSNNKLNTRITVANPFRNNWITSTDRLDSRFYDSINHNTGTSCHRYITITLNYTIAFGKKIRRGDEVSTGTSVGSAIMQ